MDVTDKSIETCAKGEKDSTITPRRHEKLMIRKSSQVGEQKWIHEK